jgi:hypothetical protein
LLPPNQPDLHPNPPNQPINRPTDQSTHPPPKQDDAIRNLFSSKTKAEYSVNTLVVFTATFFTLALVTYGVAIPTGLFVPGILLGASYGRLVGVFVADMHPRQTIDEVRGRIKVMSGSSKEKGWVAAARACCVRQGNACFGCVAFRCQVRPACNILACLRPSPNAADAS